MVSSLESMILSNYNDLHKSLRETPPDKTRIKELADLLEALALTRDLSRVSSYLSSELFSVYKKSEWDIRNVLNRIGESLEHKNKNISSGQIVIHSHRGGLCNRLRTICALAVATDHFSLDLPNIIWVKDDACPEDITNLFDTSTARLPFINITEKEYKDIVNKDTSIIAHTPHNPRSAWEIYLKDSMTFSNFTIRYASKIGDLFKFSRDSINYRATDISNKLRQNKSVGIHLRRGDFVEHYKKKTGHDLASIKEIAAYCRANLADHIIYLACDEASANAEFVEEIGSDMTVIYNSNQYQRKGKRETAVSDAMVDLKALGSCDRIIGTQGSSFSDMALTLIQGRAQNTNNCFKPLGLRGFVVSS